MYLHDTCLNVPCVQLYQSTNQAKEKLSNFLTSLANNYSESRGKEIHPINVRLLLLEVAN